MILMPPVERQAQQLAAAGRYLAGGGLGLFVLPPELNLVVAHAKGAHLWDVAGREYIDYHLGSGPALLGHAHPAVTAAVAAQLGKGTTFYFLNEPEIALAQRLVEAIPCADVVHYVGSGTEATFYALRIARASHGPQQGPQVRRRVARHARLRIVGHGPDDAVRTIRARSPTRSVFRRRPAKRCWSRRSTKRSRRSRMIERHAHELAAVIVEPLQRVLLPEPGILAALRDVTRRHGIVLIFDEIVTGFRIALGRRAAEVRRRSRSRLLRQGGQRRLSAGGDCRQRRRDGGARRARAPRATRRVGHQHAERQSGVRAARLRRARRAVATGNL